MQLKSTLLSSLEQLAIQFSKQSQSWFGVLVVALLKINLVKRQSHQKIGWEASVVHSFHAFTFPLAASSAR